MLYDFEELDIPTRLCGNCTKCCDGYLHGEAYGKKFFKGTPCHFVSEKGCSIYKDRPFSPCQTYSCVWLHDKYLPEWLKPSLSNVIVSKRNEKDFDFIEVIEAGKIIESNILIWLIDYSLEYKINLKIQVDSGWHWYGTKEFKGVRP